MAKKNRVEILTEERDCLDRVEENPCGMQQEKLLQVENKVNFHEDGFREKKRFILAETTPTESNTVLFVGSRSSVREFRENFFALISSVFS